MPSCGRNTEGSIAVFPKRTLGEIDYLSRFPRVFPSGLVGSYSRDGCRHTFFGVRWIDIIVGGGRFFMFHHALR